jgi:hypothetical protein
MLLPTTSTRNKRNKNKSRKFYRSQKALLSMKGIDRGQAPYSPCPSPPPSFFLLPISNNNATQNGNIDKLQTQVTILESKERRFYKSLHKSFGELILKFTERNLTFTLMCITIKREGKKKTKSSRGSNHKLKYNL